ncbi:MAG: Tetracycline regulation of excision, RteC [bacterium P3]|nr:MAG: Tetracycline regulation of excision, RteC [bacterium P3]
MDYFILTDNSLFRLINGEADVSPAEAYQDFVVQVINLCKQGDNGYKAVALTYAETELQFAKSVSDEINRYVKKAQAFIQKMQRLVTGDQPVILSHEEKQAPSGLRWTGQNTDFVELIYGLHTMKCINDGDISLKDILTSFMQFLDFEKPLANCYITYRDVKMRKLDNRATFLQDMTNELNWRMKEDDRKQAARR